MSMPARPPRKWTIVGDGIDTFGVTVVTDARYRKSATWMGWVCRSLPTTVNLGGVMCTVSAASELAAMLPVTATPSSCWRKSRWNQARRNSPSVAARIPVASSLPTASAIASSSTARSSSADEFAGGAPCARRVDGRRAEQAADVVGAERWVQVARGCHQGAPSYVPLRIGTAHGAARRPHRDARSRLERPERRH